MPPKLENCMKRIVGIFLLSIVSSFVIAQEKSRPVQPDFPGDIMVDYGFNFWNNEPDNFPATFWGSNSIGVYYNHRWEISSHISFHSSLGVTIDKYASDDRYTWLRDSDGTVSFDTLTGVGFAKNKLVSTYAELPVEFRIHPLGTKNGEGWFIGLGGFLGRRLGAHTKIKFQSVDGEFKEKLYSDFDLVDFRYGLQGRFGFRTFHVFYKHYLNKTFNNAPDGTNNPQTWTIGINFSGF